MNVAVRNAVRGDLTALVAIHNYYVEHSFASFDVRPATIAERQTWFERYGLAGPYQIFVAEADGTVAGLCYSSRYREHAAFERTVETSIYLTPGAAGKGIGTALYARLMETLASADVHCAVAGIALPNEPSIRLHRRFGFRDVGVFEEYACKSGAFISSLWLQRLFS